MSSAKNGRVPAKVKQVSRGVIKTVAGMALTTPADFVRLAAHASDHLLKGDFSEAIANTYSFFVNKGEIDPKYFDSKQFADLAPEWGRVKREAYGVDKLDALRCIFVNLARNRDPDGYKKYLLDIALDMTEPEIKVLIADAELAQTVRDDSTLRRLRSTADWINEVTELSDLRHGSLVITAEDGLMAKGLISSRLRNDRSGTDFILDHGRLSSAGAELYQLMLLENDPVQTS